MQESSKKRVPELFAKANIIKKMAEKGRKSLEDTPENQKKNPGH